MALVQHRAGQRERSDGVFEPVSPPVVVSPPNDGVGQLRRMLEVGGNAAVDSSGVKVLVDQSGRSKRGALGHGCGVRDEEIDDRRGQRRVQWDNPAGIVDAWSPSKALGHVDQAEKPGAVLGEQFGKEFAEGSARHRDGGRPPREGRATGDRRHPRVGGRVR